MGKKFKLALYRFFKSKACYVLLIFLFLSLIVGISASRSGEFNVADFIRMDMVLSFSITGIAALIIAVIVRFVEYKIEDSIKIDDDYKEFIQRYSAENFVHYGKIIVPLSVVAMLKPETEFEFDETTFNYSLPYVCKMHFSSLFSAHKHSVVFNNDIVRLMDVSLDNKKLVLTTCHTNYFNSLVTNRACDFRLGNHLTIRRIFEYKSTFTPLRESQLSNELDVIGYVFTSDGYLVFFRRDRHKSIAKNKLGNTFGHPIGYDGKNKLTQSYLESHMLKQIQARYRIDPSLVTKKETVAIVRTASEAGKPGLIYNVTLNITHNEFYEHTTRGLSPQNARNYRSRFILAHPSEITIPTADKFIIGGKVYPSTIDFVGEYLICTRLGKTSPETPLW